MDLLYIKLNDVCDSNGRSIPACVRKSSSGDTAKYVVAFGEGRRDEFYLHTVIDAALRDEGDFIVADLWDGSADYTIPLPEIKALVRQVMGRHLVDTGRFEVAVAFVAHDPRCPF